MKKLIFVFTAVVFAFLAAPAAKAALVTGEKAPDFSLPDQNGQSHGLSESQGRYVVLEWTNPDCPFVRKHYGSGNMQALQAEYTQKGVVWYSIASSAPEKQGYYTADEWKTLVPERKMSSTAVLLDPDGRVGKLYGAQTTPHMYVIDPEGKLIYQGAIDSIASPDPDDIAEADNYVRNALDEAMSGQPVSSASTKAYGCSVKY